MKKVIQQQQRDWWAEVRVRQRDWLYAGLLRNQAACGPLRFRAFASVRGANAASITSIELRPSCCGIGYHGDTERKRVVAIRLGVSIPLVFGWWHRHQPVGEKHVLSLHHGDMYVMSEKATGFDWKRSSVHTLRHAAGCEKYTGLRSDPPIEKRALAAGVPSAATGVACAVARELRATPLPERSRLLALLQTLESAAIDVDALAASGVAKLVKTLRTRSDVPVMAALATELFASWKLVAKEAGVVKTGQSQKKRPKVER